MVRDEVLGSLDDPCEVANAELVDLEQRRREGQASRVCEPFRAAGGVVCRGRVEPSFPQALCGLQIQAEEIAVVISIGT